MFKRSKASKLLRQLQLKQLDEPEQPAPKQDYLSERDCHRTYSCIHCRAHLANHDELISKLFQGNHGRAYLFNKVVNVGCKQAVERELLTGLHAVADIYCDCCETTLGWKYEQAFVPSQKYKEGKYIIELVHMLKENTWDLSSYNSKDLLEQQLAEELAELVAERNVSSSRYRTLVNDTETPMGLSSRYLSAASGERNSATPEPPAAARRNSRKHISNSSPYNTLRASHLVESKFNNLNVSGASANSDGAGGSGSSENLGQSASLDHGHQDHGTTTDQRARGQQQQHEQKPPGAVRRVVGDANIQDDTNKTMTTRETFEIDQSQPESAGSENNNSAAISV